MKWIDLTVFINMCKLKKKKKKQEGRSGWVYGEECSRPMVAILVDTVMFVRVQGACWGVSAWSFGTWFLTILPCQYADLHVRLDQHVMLNKGPASKNSHKEKGIQEKRLKTKKGLQGEVEFS